MNARTCGLAAIAACVALAGCASPGTPTTTTLDHDSLRRLLEQTEQNMRLVEQMQQRMPIGGGCPIPVC
ncbi:hypothetical protein [Azohydromonas aeria]|uniref:hypothetical protein n=1 Tax=Azohydromonas aeria TaxID=2590212 RepID=UPI0012F85EEB|nr:hypothetical protein [Azohydromonas aeria]